MRIEAVCATCADAWDDTQAVRPELILGELHDSGLVHVDCPRGHQSIVLYDARRYQLLMTSASKALLDGYTNEAIAVFATALERAYEFFIRVVFRHKRIDDSAFDAAWKDVAKQSERQFGAFHFIYLSELGSMLPLNPKLAEIRNKIVHSGNIATEEEARYYAEQIFERISQIERCLEQNYDSATHEQAKYEIDKQRASVPRGQDSVVMKSFSVKVHDDGTATRTPPTFSEFLAALHRSRASGTF